VHVFEGIIGCGSSAKLTYVDLYADEMMRFPCMVHVDPIEGQHESIEGLLRR